MFSEDISTGDREDHGVFSEDISTGNRDVGCLVKILAQVTGMWGV